MLRDKRIVVTGAGQGIGAACARALAVLGASVVVNDLNEELASSVAIDIRAQGGNAVAHPCDISLERSAIELIDRCVDEYGTIDGLLNNAGLFRLSHLADMVEAEMRQIFDVNVFGAAFCAKRAAKHMMGQRSGSIVNVTSGSYLGLRDMGAYGASKGAIASFTFTWAIELEAFGVRVNAMSPRAFTKMTEVHADYQRSRGETVTWTGTGNYSPDANAPVACFLLSDRARDVTGQIVRIDGDDLALIAQPDFIRPSKGSDEWTLAAIVEAFDRELKKKQSPVGIVAARRLEKSI